VWSGGSGGSGWEGVGVGGLDMSLVLEPPRTYSLKYGPPSIQ
jgi:hypothetical protein